MKHLMLLEPNAKLRAQIRDTLLRAGYTCRFADSPDAALAMLRFGAPDLFMVDTRVSWVQCLPLLNAMHESTCPVLFIASEAANESHLRAIYRSSSGVILPPFDSKTLLSAVSGLLRASNSLLTQGALQLDLGRRRVLYRGERLELTAQEFELLRCLMQSAGSAVTREELLRDAWGYASNGETRTVDVHVQRLRKKLGSESIETVYRRGYKLNVA